MTKFNYMPIFRKTKHFQKVINNMHINFSLKVWEEFITQSRYHLFKTCRKNDKVQLHVNLTKIVRKLPQKSHAHLQCVHNGCVKFIECQQRSLRDDYTMLVPVLSIQEMLEKWLHVNFSKYVRTFPESHMLIFNASNNCVRYGIWEELITNSRCRLFN
jgi:hypothetical protein